LVGSLKIHEITDDFILNIQDIVYFAKQNDGRYVRLMIILDLKPSNRILSQIDQS